MKKFISRLIFGGDDPKLVNDLLVYNLMCSNPNMAKAVKKKREKGVKITASSFLGKTIGISFVFITFIYCFIFFRYPFEVRPVTYDYTVLMMILLILMNTMSVYFTVFYDGHDLELYKPLPISPKTVYAVKNVIVFLSVLTWGGLVFALNFGFLMQMGSSIDTPLAVGYSIIMGIVNTLGIMFISMALNMILIELLLRSSVFLRIKKTVFKVINVVTLIVSIAIILFIVNVSNKQITVTGNETPSEIRRIMSELASFGPISYLMSNPLGAVIFSACLIFVALLIYLAIIRGYNRNFYAYIEKIQKKGGVARRIDDEKSSDVQGGVYSPENESKESYTEIPEMKAERISLGKGSLGKSFFMYNLKLLGMGNTAMMGILMPYVLQIAMFGPNIMLFAKYEIPGFIVGSGIGVLSMCTASGLPAIIFSLDRENFEFFKCMPIGKKEFFFKKIMFVMSIFLTLNTICTIALMLLMGSGDIMQLIIALLMCWAWTLTIGIAWSIYDYKHPYTKWQNPLDITGRMSKGLQFLSTFGLIMIVLIISLMGMMVSFIAVEVIVLAVLVVSIIAVGYLLHREFFRIK